MLQVLIVDDEPFIRQGLALLIDWNKEGYHIAGEAGNGTQAIEFLRHNKVDLIIADIKMPEMNGIELLEHIHMENLSDAHYIILSGFFDFTYAKAAILYNCCDYILKPIQKEELLQVIRKVAKECNEKDHMKQDQEEMARALFDRNLLMIICGKYDQSNLDYVSSHMRLSSGLRYINIEVNFDVSENDLTEEDKRYAQKQLYQECKNILLEDEYHVILDVSKQELTYDIGFIYCDYLGKNSGMTGREYMEWFAQQLKKTMDYSISMYVGNKVESIEQLSESYHTATIAKTFQLFRADVDIAYYEEQSKENSGSLLSKQTLDYLYHAVEENSITQISDAVDKIYDEINEKNMEYEQIIVSIDYILFQFIHLASEQDNNVNQKEIMQYLTRGTFEQETIRGSKSNFKKFVFEVSNYIMELRKNASKGVIAKVEKDIAQNYAENISLKSLSEKYFINSAYLGQIFKKSFNQSFKDYLNAYRIDKACELLIHTDEKVYLVAERVGYHNLDYFINKFVAYKGCTPTKYRKQCIKNE